MEYKKSLLPNICRDEASTISLSSTTHLIPSATYTPSMYRAQIKYIVDVGLAVSFILCFITGVIKFPGFIRAIGATHRVLPMRDLTLIHDWTGILMGLLVAVHLILNYRWIIAMTRQIFGGKRMSEAGE